MCGGREERENKTTSTNTFWKERGAGNISEQRDKGWIHVIRVHDTIHLAVTTLRGSRCARTTPHKERLSGLVKHRDYPTHSYIVNERDRNPGFSAAGDAAARSVVFVFIQINTSHLLQLKKLMSTVFHCQQKDQSWSGSGAMSEISSTTKSA